MMFPVGLQLQARWKSPETTKKMLYRWEKTQDIQRECKESPKAPKIYDDTLCG